jgi:hypothetical protein
MGSTDANSDGENHRNKTKSSPDVRPERYEPVLPVTYHELKVFRSFIVLDEVTITADDYPGCLGNSAFDCSLCEFFTPDYCRLRNEPWLREEVEDSFTKVRQWELRRRSNELAQAERRRHLVQALIRELAAHGRPLHYSFIGKMVRERYPHLKASDGEVMHVLRQRSDVFSPVFPGVYTVNSSAASDE